MKLEKQLQIWVDQALISSDQMDAITRFEIESGKSNYLMRALVIGGLAIALGLAALVSANWNELGDLAKVFGHLGLSGALSYAFYRCRDAEKFPRIREILLLLIFASILTFIALMGQIFQTQAPMVVPLTVWLVLGSPLVLLFSNARTVIGLWLAALIGQQVALHFWMLEKFNDPSLQLALCTLFAYTFFALGQIKKIREVVADTFFLYGASVLIFVPAAAQIFWRFDIPGTHPEAQNIFAYLWPSIVVAGCITALMVMATKTFPCRWSVRDILALSLPAIVFACLPLLVPHTENPVLAGVMFIIWWLWIGYLGLHLSDRLVDLAVAMIALRVFVFYLEALGSLTMTGFGLIFGGVLFIALTYGVMKLRPVLHRYTPERLQ